jgi:hypothetical protein
MELFDFSLLFWGGFMTAYRKSRVADYILWHKMSTRAYNLYRRLMLLSILFDQLEVLLSPIMIRLSKAIALFRQQFKHGDELIS